MVMNTWEEYCLVEEYEDRIEVNIISDQSSDICHSIVSCIGFQICFKTLGCSGGRNMFLADLMHI
jgi:hypothetical protein